MVTADVVVIVAFIVFALTGVVVGFGRGLKFFTGGVLGLIISVIVCYLIFGFVLDISFVKELCNKFLEWLNSKGSVGSFFADIHLDYVALAVVLFVIVQIIRIIIVKIIRRVFEIDNAAVKVLNKVFGAVLFVLVFVATMLIVFQIVAWVGSDTAENFLKNIQGSFFKLDDLYENNPLLSIFN